MSTTGPGAIGDAIARPARIDDRPAASDAARLKELSAEFESMLLAQMLRTMREAGSWKEEGDGEGLGADALLDTLDAELSRHLARAQGFGLDKTLVPQLLHSPADGEAAGATAGPGVAPGAPAAPALSVGVAMGPADTAGASTRAVAVADVGVDLDRTVTSPFGWRRDPFTGGLTYHRGVDLRAAYGEPVAAMAGGRVVFAGEQRGYGQTVVVEHADGVRSRYAHLSSILVAGGAEVAAGASIGRAGRSGRATGTHLHVEVTQDGHPIDPVRSGLAPLKPERVVADLGVGRDPSGRRRAD